MPKPGYKTTEHAITWAVIVLASVAMFRGSESSERMVAAVAAAVASGAYCQSRSRVKTERPFDLAEMLTDAFTNTSKERPGRNPPK